MKRPVGITLLSILFTWLALAGAWNANNALNGAFTGISPAFSYVGFIYAGTALAAAVGLWLMKPWALYALYAWMALCIGLFVTIGGFEGGGLMGRFGFLIFVLVVFIGLHRYVSGTFGRADQ